MGAPDDSGAWLLTSNSPTALNRWATPVSGIEDQACDLVGGQFYDDLQVHEGGHHQAQWLRALAERAGAALRAAIAGGGDWRPRPGSRCS